MNYLFYLPRDLQRLVARYLIPLPLPTNLWLNEMKLIIQYQHETMPNLQSVHLFQELTGQTFSSLLAWDVGVSVIQRPLTVNELASVFSCTRATRLPFYGLILVLYLGLWEKLVEWTTPSETIPASWSESVLQLIKTEFGIYASREVSSEMSFYLLDFGYVNIDERQVLRLKSIPRLEQYLAANERNKIHISTLIFSLDGSAEMNAILTYYLEKLGEINFADFLRIVEHSFNRRIDYTPLIEKLNLVDRWYSKHEVESLFHTFAHRVCLQLPSDYVCLEQLYLLLQAGLEKWEWEELIEKCMKILHRQHSEVIDPQTYYYFYQLYFQTRLTPVNYHTYHLQISRLKNCEQVKAALVPLFVRALSSGLIHNKKKGQIKKKRNKNVNDE